MKVTSFRVEILGGEGTSADVQIFGENFAGVDTNAVSQTNPVSTETKVEQ